MTKIIGASAILSYGDKYVFEIQKAHKWDRSSADIEIGIGCIGGSLEGEETPSDALQRESLEEIQAPVKILKWNKPFIITDEFAVRDCKGEGIDNLFFYWQGTRRPYQDCRVCVYMGKALEEPFPDDLPGILISDIALLMECFQENLTLEQSIAKGIKLVSRREIPLKARIKPAGTTAVLQELYLNNYNRIEHLFN